MRKFRFIVGLGIASFLTILMIFLPTKAQESSRNFVLQGQGIDWCLAFGQNCGEPAANYFCQQQGYSHAISHQIRIVNTTRIMGSGQVCTVGVNSGVCDEFTNIVCAQAQASQASTWILEAPGIQVLNNTSCNMSGAFSVPLVLSGSSLSGHMSWSWNGQQYPSPISGTISGNNVQLNFASPAVVVLSYLLNGSLNQRGEFVGTAKILDGPCRGLSGSFTLRPESPNPQPQNRPNNSSSSATASNIPQEMVNAHNQWRSKLGLPPLRWSDEVANVAQEHANYLASTGRFEHNPGTRYGENIFMAMGRQYSPKEVVDEWGSEVAYYDYATNSCRPGEMCGHYTQIVWRDTTEVGCGVARSGNREVWVCNYNPHGNSIGQKPY